MQCQKTSDTSVGEQTAAHKQHQELVLYKNLGFLQEIEPAFKLCLFLATIHGRPQYLPLHSTTVKGNNPAKLVPSQESIKGKVCLSETTQSIKEDDH